MASTSRGQRIGIWIITIFMMLGVVVSFAAMIVGTQNSVEDSKIAQEKYAEYQVAYEEYKKKIEAQNGELSSKYYDVLKSYSAQPASFDAGSVTSLSTKDLVVGSGDEITKDSDYTVYYIGWTPDGKVFDQSIDVEKGALKSPIDSSVQTIPGWSEGIMGMKIGGVREISIPADKAYGKTGNGDIKPDTPLKFIVLVVKRPEKIEQPKYESM